MLTAMLFLTSYIYRNVTVQDIRWETKCQTLNTSRPECTTNWETRDRTVVRQECDQVIETVCTNYTVPVYEVVSLWIKPRFKFVYVQETQIDFLLPMYVLDPWTDLVQDMTSHYSSSDWAKINPLKPVITFKSCHFLMLKMKFQHEQSAQSTFQRHIQN